MTKTERRALAFLVREAANHADALDHGRRREGLILADALEQPERVEELDEQTSFEGFGR